MARTPLQALSASLQQSIQRLNEAGSKALELTLEALALFDAATAQLQQENPSDTLVSYLEQDAHQFFTSPHQVRALRRFSKMSPRIREISQSWGLSRDELVAKFGNQAFQSTNFVLELSKLAAISPFDNAFPLLQKSANDRAYRREKRPGQSRRDWEPQDVILVCTKITKGLVSQLESTWGLTQENLITRFGIDAANSANILHGLVRLSTISSFESAYPKLQDVATRRRSTSRLGRRSNTDLLRVSDIMEVISQMEEQKERTEAIPSPPISEEDPSSPHSDSRHTKAAVSLTTDDDTVLDRMNTLACSKAMVTLGGREDDESEDYGFGAMPDFNSDVTSDREWQDIDSDGESPSFQLNRRDQELRQASSHGSIRLDVNTLKRKVNNEEISNNVQKKGKTREFDLKSTLPDVEYGRKAPLQEPLEDAINDSFNPDHGDFNTASRNMFYDPNIDPPQGVEPLDCAEKLPKLQNEEDDGNGTWQFPLADSIFVDDSFQFQTVDPKHRLTIQTASVSASQLKMVSSTKTELSQRGRIQLSQDNQAVQFGDRPSRKDEKESRPDLVDLSALETDETIRIESLMSAAEGYENAKATLLPGKWLNGDAIHGILEMFQRQDVRILHFSCLSMKTDLPRRKVTSYNLHGCTKVLIPLHHSNHWSMAFVDSKLKSMEIYDSFSPTETSFRGKNALQEFFDCSSERPWSFRLIDNPRQTNTSDCGIYALVFAICRLYDIQMPVEVESLTWRKLFFSVFESKLAIIGNVDQISTINRGPGDGTLGHIRNVSDPLITTIATLESRLTNLKTMEELTYKARCNLSTEYLERRKCMDLVQQDDAFRRKIYEFPIYLRLPFLEILTTEVQTARMTIRTQEKFHEQRHVILTRLEIIGRELRKASEQALAKLTVLQLENEKDEELVALAGERVEQRARVALDLSSPLF